VKGSLGRIKTCNDYQSRVRNAGPSSRGDITKFVMCRRRNRADVQVALARYLSHLQNRLMDGHLQSTPARIHPECRSRKWVKTLVVAVRERRSELHGCQSVFVAAGKHSPGDACELVGHGDDNDVLGCSGVECIEPGSDRRSIALDPQHGVSCTMNQDLAQIYVAALTDAE
jgi:hypothetical protein